MGLRGRASNVRSSELQIKFKHVALAVKQLYEKAKQFVRFALNAHRGRA